MSSFNTFNAQAPAIAIPFTTTVSAPVTLPNIGKKIRILSTGAGTVAFFSIDGTAVVANATPSRNATPFLVGSDTVLDISSDLDPATYAPKPHTITIIGLGSGTAYVQVGEGS